MSEIEALTGLKRRANRVRLFLEIPGMKRRKIGMIPAKTDTEQQQGLKKTLQDRLEEAKNHQRVVFIVDAAHFEFAPFLVYLRCVARRFIHAPSGRKRCNVRGALNAIAHELATVTHDTDINARSAFELLEKIHALRFAMPNILILDNARYKIMFNRDGCRRTIGDCVTLLAVRFSDSPILRFSI